MAAILISANLNSSILDLAILVFSLKLTHTCQDWFPPFAQKKTSLLYSDSTWWLQLSWNLPSLIQPFCTKNKFTHSLSLNLMMVAILNSATLNSALLVFPLKLTHTCQDWFPPFAQKKLHSFILTQLDDCSYLEICHLLFSHFAQKKLQSFILTHLDDGSHFEFCHLGFSHFA